ncbi:MAG: hypothetical protein RJA81_1625 [Planctomycetota bacterium]|jgi:uncharacterized protein YndB with AHSA1/START domain
MQEMKPIEFQFTLPADLETSWKWLTEEELQKKWMKGLISLKRDDGSTEYVAGTRWHMVMQEGKKQKDYYATMPEVDRPNRFTLAIDAENLALGGKILVEYKLTSIGNETVLDYRSKLVAERFGLFLKIISPLVMMMIRMNTRKMFNGLIAQMSVAN